MRKKRIVGIVLVSISVLLITSVILIIASKAALNTFLSFLLRLIAVYPSPIYITLLIIGIVLIVKGKSINIEMQPVAEIAQQLKNSLPPSPTPLNDNNVRKIHMLFPVPKDYKILWAEVQSFGNHPSGVVITNEALILKAPKSEVKKKNAEIKKANKKKSKNQRQPKVSYVYRIIPWQYFSPEDYSFYTDVDNSQRFIIIDKSAAFRIDTEELFKSFASLQKKYIDIEKELSDYEVASVSSAINTINVESTIYMAKNGAANTNTGHGIIAEDAGTLLDNMKGIKATVVGRNNARNGPDKLVNLDGIQTAIQCKYCKSAVDSVQACFGDDGLFRYYDLNGNAMTIEVPKEQYLKAVEEMRYKILDGKVPGVTDPDKAISIIRKGSLTYEQARNLAKAGTFESITYDTATATVRCLSVFGISFLFVFAHVFWETQDARQAVRSALAVGAKIYGLSILGSVISSQLARAGIENLFYPMMKDVLDKLPERFVERMAKNTRGFVRPEMAAVDATKNYFARFLSAQASSLCVMYFVFSIPDIYCLISNNMSAGQFVMNMAERFAGMTAGSIAGAYLGGLAGNTFNPIVGGIVGFGAGTIIGSGTEYIVKTIVHLFREDDNTIVSRMFTAVLINTAMDYALSKDEQEKLVNALEQDKKRLKRLQKKLIKSPTQSADIKKYLSSKINGIIKCRRHMNVQDEQSIKNRVDDIISKGEMRYEM